jgi:hypothetical protein
MVRKIELMKYFQVSMHKSDGPSGPVSIFKIPDRLSDIAEY